MIENSDSQATVNDLALIYSKLDAFLTTHKKKKFKKNFIHISKKYPPPQNGSRHKLDFLVNRIIGVFF